MLENFFHENFFYELYKDRKNLFRGSSLSASDGSTGGRVGGDILPPAQ